MLSSTTSLSAQNLILSFDDLKNDRKYYFLKLINCTYDWKKSALSDLDFIESYNQFPVNDYTFSANVYTPYVHYRIAIPTVKISGNYIVLIYRDHEDVPVISHRIMIYSSQTSITMNNEFIGYGNLSQATQPLNFTLHYSAPELMNPSQNIHVVIRQNQRWDNALTMLPMYVREESRELEYRQSDSQNQFQAGNEFRLVDFRSILYPGQNTDVLDRRKRPISLTVSTDKPREGAYAQYVDINGNYLVVNQDRGGGDITSDYVDVNFTLQTPNINRNVYIIGAFNNWQLNNENKMEYQPSIQSYSKNIVLKQGFYNYQYWVEEKGFELEGSHFETENNYEILVYYKAFQPYTDVLIGYFQVNKNQR